MKHIITAAHYINILKNPSLKKNVLKSCVRKFWCWRWCGFVLDISGGGGVRSPVELKL